MMLLKQNESVLISGKITSGPEIKEARNGRLVATFSIRYDYDKNAGSGKFMHVCVWGDDGSDCAQLYQKGDSVIVMGRLSSYEYNGKTYSSVIADTIVPGTGVVISMSVAKGSRREALN